MSLHDSGRIKIDYPVRPFMQEAFRAAHEAVARVSLAGGAREVVTLHPEMLRLRSEADLGLLDTVRYGALEHSIFTAHQMGGCAMGTDPDTSVVNNQHRHHHVPNLFIVDGSIFPTSLGVNPSETIYALAHRARDFVAEAV